MKFPKLSPFAHLAIHTMCDAHLFDDGENVDLTIPFEYLNLEDRPYPRIHPYARKITRGKRAGLLDFYAQGQYLYLRESPSDLKLVCDELRALGIEHYAFIDLDNCQHRTPDYILWVPELDHMNKDLRSAEPSYPYYGPADPDVIIEIPV